MKIVNGPFEPTPEQTQQRTDLQSAIERFRAVRTAPDPIAAIVARLSDNHETS